MSDEKERGPQIVDAYQELVQRIEQGTGRMRALSIVTIAVAVVLAVSYVSQLALPLTGTVTVTVDLNDPGTVAAELIVLALVLTWLYVGLQDLRFSWRMKGEIREARTKEKEIEARLA
jgi:uncharacterized membrane protein (DUF485 family)